MRWPVALAAVAAVAAATELGATAAAAAAQPIEARAAPPLPSARQRDYIGWGLEMFVHFSITTFTGSQTGDQDPRAFAPDPKTLNVSQWVATAKALGAPVVALTAKHEAGFCIWPSNYSNYTIAASPTVGHRDLVREFVDECHKQDILPGFYFTTGAWVPSGPYCRAGASAGECDFEYQKNQITELATQYGDIAYWWFDHHNSDPVHEMYDQVVAKYLPHAVRMGPDSWLTGEESGFAHYPLYYGCDTNDNTSYGRCLKPQAGSGSPTGAIFKAWESDCSIYNGCHPWFPGGTVQSADTIRQHWENTWGRGTNYIWNFPPSKAGIMPDDFITAAHNFANVRAMYDDSAAVGHAEAAVGVASASGALTLSFAKPQKVDRLLLEEVELLTKGQQVTQYVVEAQQSQAAGGGGSWSAVPLNTNSSGGCALHKYSRCGGFTIGTHHLDTFEPPLASVSALRVRVLGTITSGATPRVSAKVFCTAC